LKAAASFGASCLRTMVSPDLATGIGDFLSFGREMRHGSQSGSVPEGSLRGQV
jgi:hypothetical protein